MSSDSQNSRDYQIELVDKVVRLLETLRDAPPGLTLQELARRTGYVKSSIHRTLASLKRHGYVDQGRSGGPYSLGVRCLLLGRGLKEGIELLRYARPCMQEIVDSFNESAYLAILRGGRGIFVEVVEARRRDLRLVGPLGASVFYHATAAGKVFAAFQTVAARTSLLDAIDLRPLTPRTLVRRGDVEKEWALVARRGLALNREESIVGAVFLAVPIFDAESSVCGAISVGVPKARYTPVIGRRIGERLTAGTSDLSSLLHAAGYVHEDCRIAELKPRPAE